MEGGGHPAAGVVYDKEGAGGVAVKLGAEGGALQNAGNFGWFLVKVCQEFLNCRNIIGFILKIFSSFIKLCFR